MSDFDHFVRKLRNELSLLKQRVVSVEAASLHLLRANGIVDGQRMSLSLQEIDVILQTLNCLDQFLEKMSEVSELTGSIDFDSAASDLPLLDFKGRITGVQMSPLCDRGDEVF